MYVCVYKRCLLLRLQRLYLLYSLTDWLVGGQMFIFTIIYRKEVILRLGFLRLVGVLNNRSGWWLLNSQCVCDVGKTKSSWQDLSSTRSLILVCVRIDCGKIKPCEYEFWKYFFLLLLFLLIFFVKKAPLLSGEVNSLLGFTIILSNRLKVNSHMYFRFIAWIKHLYKLITAVDLTLSYNSHYIHVTCRSSWVVTSLYSNKLFLCLLKLLDLWPFFSSSHSLRVVFVV